MFITLMLVAHTQSKSINVVSQMANLLYMKMPTTDSKDVLHVFVYLTTVYMFCLQTLIFVIQLCVV